MDMADAPKFLSMHLSAGRRDISREAALQDAHRFGFGSKKEADAYLNQLLERIQHGFAVCAGLLTADLRSMLQARLQSGF